MPCIMSISQLVIQFRNSSITNRVCERGKKWHEIPKLKTKNIKICEIIMHARYKRQRSTFVKNEKRTVCVILILNFGSRICFRGCACMYLRSANYKIVNFAVCLCMFVQCLYPNRCSSTMLVHFKTQMCPDSQQYCLFTVFQCLTYCCCLILMFMLRRLCFTNYDSLYYRTNFECVFLFSALNISIHSSF